MIINKDGLITENQETLEETALLNTDDTNINELNNFDLTSNDNNNLKNENILLDSNDSNVNNDSIDMYSDTTSPIEDSKKETVETNCLALTVRKDYNLSIAKNTVFKTIRMSIKVAISTFVLNIIKLFF